MDQKRPDVGLALPELFFGGYSDLAEFSLWPLPAATFGHWVRYDLSPVSRAAQDCAVIGFSSWPKIAGTTRLGDLQ